MNRRKAIKNIFALSIVSGATYAGFRAFELHRATSLASFAERKTLIADLAETIIPETETPGAKAAGVENFIISVLSNCSTNVEQNLFLEGLEDVERYCARNFKKTFSSCSSAIRASVLSHFEKKELYNSMLLNKINDKFFGDPFFTKLKALTIQGYCNSFLGASKGLEYSFIPGHYASCIPIKLNQKSWATK